MPLKPLSRGVLKEKGVNPTKGLKLQGCKKSNELKKEWVPPKKGGLTPLGKNN